MFVAYPFGSILYHAFTRWDGITPAQWVGLHNFRVLWQDPIFLNALRNNAIFALSVPIQLVFPLVVAYVIHRRVWAGASSARQSSCRPSMPRS